MKTTTRTTTVTTEAGTVLNMTVVATRGYEKVNEVSYCDGDNVEIIRKEEVNTTKIIIEVKGQKIEGWFDVLPVHVQKEKGLYGVFAAKIGLSEAKYNELNSVVNAAIVESETDENWLKYQAIRAKAAKEEAEYEDHVKAVDNMMTANGRSY